ncbi:hypothetical protein [Mucilaginibacter flavidus]|nr:hypothetical protein [Mucilaginibacter flavidus]
MTYEGRDMLQETGKNYMLFHKLMLSFYGSLCSKDVIEGLSANV